MTVQTFKKWGNSPAVRIPTAIMQAAQLNLEQRIEIRAENGRIIIEPASPVFTLATLLDGITDSNRHSELDFGRPQGQEQL